MDRRQALKSGVAGVGAALAGFPTGWLRGSEDRRRRVLMFTKSGTFEHDVVRRGAGGELSLAERTLKDLGDRHGFDVTCTKDGGVFDRDDLGRYDAFVFETQGDLTRPGVDRQPPVSRRGKEALLRAIGGGKGFVGSHCASDTCHSSGDRNGSQPRDGLDPYIAMLGGEFIVHGAQQKARMRVVDGAFPGMKGVRDFDLLEEWYALKNFSPDLHVILAQDCEGMKGFMYERPPFPATWARKHHDGRVFYTSMGHREDVWRNSVFQQILLGGLGWAMGNVEADVSPNLKEATPRASEFKSRK